MSHECIIKAPSGIPILVQFATGKTVSVPADQEQRYTLTGDEVGRVEASIQAARRQAKREGAFDHEVLGGGIKVLTKNYGKVPKGSKKEKLLAKGHALPEDSPDLAGAPDNVEEALSKERERADKAEAELQRLQEHLQESMKPVPQAPPEEKKRTGKDAKKGGKS